MIPYLALMGYSTLLPIYFSYHIDTHQSPAMGMLLDTCQGCIELK